MKTEEFNFVVGYSGYVGSTIIKDGINFRVDHTEPITLKRVQKIYQDACDFADKKFDSIKIWHAIYTNEIEDDGDCLLNKEYRYYPVKNSLIIFDKGKPIYANDDGVVTTDQAALYDTLCD